MKLKTTLLAAALMTAFSFSAFATDPENEETVVKLLPHKEAGFVKVLFKSSDSQGVMIKFHGEDGIVGRDYISRKFNTGFTKVYDLSKLETGEYTIEIIHNGERVKYPISYNDTDQSVWAVQWDVFGDNGTLASASEK